MVLLVALVLVAVDHNQLRTMALETVDPINWLHPPHSCAVPPEIQVLHSVKTVYKSQDLLHQPGLEHASTGMPDQRTACAATQGMVPIMVGGATSQLNLRSLMPLSVGGCGRLQLRVPNRATSVDYCK